MIVQRHIVIRVETSRSFQTERDDRRYTQKSVRIEKIRVPVNVVKLRPVRKQVFMMIPALNHQVVQVPCGGRSNSIEKSREAPGAIHIEEFCAGLVKREFLVGEGLAKGDFKITRINVEIEQGIGTDSWSV